MDIPKGLFTRTPHEIAVGLKRAVQRSSRTAGTKYRSAMSMLNWFINRGGKGLSTWRKTRLEQAKRELRRVFHKG
jgi:hypothetical protein